MPKPEFSKLSRIQKTQVIQALKEFHEKDSKVFSRKYVHFNFEIIKSAYAASDGQTNCLFGGWGSNLASNGFCLRPMSNPNSSYDKGSCSETQLHCNPALFGKNICVDFNSRSARINAYSNCNKKFNEEGRNIDDIIGQISDNEFYKAVGTVENVCRNQSLKQSKTDMCKSILAKFNSYVPNARPKGQPDALAALESNDLEKLLEAQEDLFNEMERDENQFSEKCLSGSITRELEEFCNNIAKRILKAEELAGKLQNKVEAHLASADASCNIESDKTPNDQLNEDVNKALTAQCTEENIDARNNACGKEIACSIGSTLAGPILAGYLTLTGGNKDESSRQCLSSENDCLTNLLTSLVDYLISSVKAVWDLLGMGVDWLTEKGKNFWGWVTNAEDETSKTQEAIQNLSDQDIKEIENDSEGWFKKTLGGITSMLNEWVKTEVFCEKWSGVPNFSTCQQPMKGWECLGCGTMINGMCRMAGPMIGLIAETVLTGGALAVISKGTKGVKAGIEAMKASPKYLETLNKVKNTGFAQKLSKAKEVVITSSRLPKGQPLKYTKEMLAKLVQASKDKLSKVKSSGITDKAKDVIKKISDTRAARAVKKVNEVDDKAFKAGFDGVDKSLGKVGSAVTKSSKVNKVTPPSDNQPRVTKSTIKKELEVTDNVPETVAKFRSDLSAGKLSGDNRFISYVDPVTGERLAGVIEPTDLTKLEKSGGRVTVTRVSNDGAGEKVTLQLGDLKNIRTSNTALTSKKEYLNSTRRSGNIDKDVAQDLLRELELPPAKSFKSESGANVTLSKPFQDNGGRTFIVAEISENGKTFYQTMYRSNSQSVFRVIPARNKGVQGAPGYDKGPGEELLTVSPEFQKEITKVVGKQKELAVKAPEDLDGVLQVNRNFDDYQKYMKSADYIKKPQGSEIKLLRDSEKPLGDMAGRSFSKPESLIIKDRALKPNYSKPKDSYSFESPVYGKVEAKVYRSNDGSVEYTLLKDENNRVWFGDIANSSTSNNSRGLRTGSIQEDLAHPLWEYHSYDQAGNVKYSQIPGTTKYAGKNHPTHSQYSDMWKYIKEIPEIKRWYKENGIEVPK